MLWKNGQSEGTDLNTLVGAETPMDLLFTFGINAGGEIVGFGFDPDDQPIHGFLAAPDGQGEAENNLSQTRRTAPAHLPENAVRKMYQRLGIRRL